MNIYIYLQCVYVLLVQKALYPLSRVSITMDVNLCRE